MGRYRLDVGGLGMKQVGLEFCSYSKGAKENLEVYVGSGRNAGSLI